MARNNKRKADVFYHDRFAGVLEETDAGYRFAYDAAYLKSGKALSLSLPLREEPFESAKKEKSIVDSKGSSRKGKERETAFPRLRYAAS